MIVCIIVEQQKCFDRVLVLHSASRGVTVVLVTSLSSSGIPFLEDPNVRYRVHSLQLSGAILCPLSPVKLLVPFSIRSILTVLPHMIIAPNHSPFSKSSDYNF
jgi:hypothetical protein